MNTNRVVYTGVPLRPADVIKNLCAAVVVVLLAVGCATKGKAVESAPLLSDEISELALDFEPGLEKSDFNMNLEKPESAATAPAVKQESVGQRPKAAAAPRSEPQKSRTGGKPARVIWIPERRVYQVQFGAFLKLQNAHTAANILRNAGLNPVFERYEDFYRVVLNNIDGNSITDLAIQAGNLGFSEILVRKIP